MLLPFPFMVNERAKVHIPHKIIVPNNNQRLPQRSNTKVNIKEAGNSVVDANVNAMNTFKPIVVILRIYPSKTSDTDIKMTIINRTVFLRRGVLNRSSNE